MGLTVFLLFSILFITLTCGVGATVLLSKNTGHMVYDVLWRIETSKHDKFLAHAQTPNMTIQQMPLQPMTDPNPPTPGYEVLTDNARLALKKAFAAESTGDIAAYNGFIMWHNAFVCLHAQAAKDNITMAICDGQMIQMGIQVHNPQNGFPQWFINLVDDYLKYRRIA